MALHYAVAVDHPAAAGWLAPAQRRGRGAAATSPEHRSDWRAGRIAAQWAAAGALGLDDPARVALLPVSGAPPVVALRDASGSHRIVPVALSLSHRYRRAAAAATRDSGGLGVDLELAGQVRAAHAGYYLTHSERALVGVYGLTALWTLKEAAWKALRCDDTVPFTALELEFDTAGAVAAVALSGHRRPAAARVLHPWRGYVLAVVWVPGQPR